MPRSSSRRRSHRSRDGRERSDSEASRDRKQREGESGTRISKVPGSEKRELSSYQGPVGGDYAAEHVKKRKFREDDAVVASDRSVGGTAPKGPKSEAYGPADLEEKFTRPKLSAGDSKSRSSRRRQGSIERHEGIQSKAMLEKQKSEKDSGRRESGSQYKDAKERDRERRSEKNERVSNSRHDKSDEVSGRGAKTASVEIHDAGKKDKETTGWHLRDELHSPELEEELEQHIRRNGSSDKDKWQGGNRLSGDRWCNENVDGRYKESDHHRCRESEDKQHRESDNRQYRESGDQQLSSRDRTKICTHGDKWHKDDRNSDRRYSRDKCREDLDGNHRHRDVRHHDEYSLRNHASDWFETRNTNDVKPSEGHHKRNKYQDSGHDGGTYVEDHAAKFKDIRGQKRPFDEHDHKGLMLRSTKQYRGDVEKNASSTGRSGTHMEKTRSEYRPAHKCDSSLSDFWSKNSPSPTSHATKDLIRYGSKFGESAHRESLPSERFHPTAVAARSHASVSGEWDREVESQTWDEIKQKDNINSSDLLEIDAASKNHRTLRSDGPTSPNSVAEKSPYKSEQRASNRAKSALNSVEDDNTFASGDHTTNNHYKRNNYYTERGQENAWNMLPFPPVADGFTPFQHGPPYPGFPWAIQQYTPSVLCGIRPSMDMNPTGLSYHVNDVADRFSGPDHSFGWHNTLHTSCSQLQGWNGGSTVFSEQFRAYGRREWDPNKHWMGSRRWETNISKQKGPNGYMNMESSVPKKEPEHKTGGLTDDACTEQSSHGSHKERGHSESVSDEKTKFRQLNDIPSAKHAAEVPPKDIHKKMTKASEVIADDSSRISNMYLSKLDISIGLTRKDLYKQCIPLLGARVQPGESVFHENGYSQDAKAAAEDANYISNYGFPKRIDDVLQTDKGDAKAVTDYSSYMLNSVIPKARGDVFQRAISIYKKQNEANKFPGLSVLQKEDESTSEAFDTEKVRPVDYETSKATSQENADLNMNIKEDANVLTDGETGDADDTKKRHSEFTSDAIVFVESSQACGVIMPECRPIQSSQSYDAIMPECRLSRIHNSHGSTL